MKHAFLLDENVWEYAALGRDERGQENASAGTLILLIGENCHSLVFSSELWDRCLKRLSALSQVGAPYSSNVQDRFRSTVHNTEKFVFDPIPPELVDETLIPEDDRYIVRLAVAVGAVLVTTDNRLISAVGRVDLPNLHARRPEDALPLAQET